MSSTLPKLSAEVVVGGYSIAAVLDTRAHHQICLARPSDSTAAAPHHVKVSLTGPGAAVSRQCLEYETELLGATDHPLFTRPIALHRLADRTLLDFGPVAGIPLRLIHEYCRRTGVRLAPAEVVRVLSACLEAATDLRPVCHEKVMVSGLLFHGWGETTLLVAPDGGIRALGLSDIVVNGARLDPWTWTALTSPEYCVPGPAIGPAADVYAAGALLFRMLTQRPLISARRVDTTILRRMFRDVRPLPSDVYRDLAPFDPVVDRALACDPSGRFASTDEFLSALHSLGGAPEAPGARSLASLCGEVAELSRAGQAEGVPMEVVGARPTEVL